MTASSRLSAWLPLALCLGAPCVASAQEVTPAKHQLAVRDFLAGRKYVEQGNCKDAIPLFIESLRSEQSVGARFNLAECSRAEQHNADAWNNFKLAEQIAIQKHDNERRDAAQKAIAELEPKVLKLRLNLPTNVRDLTVKIDGRAVADVDYAQLTTSYAVEPGQAHRIDVTATNRAPWTKADVQGAAGAELPTINVDLGAPREAEGASAGAGRRLAGLVVGGVGVAGIAVGSVFGLLAAGKKSDASSACGGDIKHCSNVDGAPNGPGLNKSAVDKLDSAKGLALVSDIGFIAGAVLVAGGAVLFFTAPKDGDKGKEAARLHVAPAVGPGLTGAFVGGSF